MSTVYFFSTLIPDPDLNITLETGKKTGTVHALPPTAIVYLGDAEKLTPTVYRKAGGALGHWLVKNKSEAANLILPAGISTDALQALLEGVMVGAYRFSKYKNAENPEAIQLALATPDEIDLTPIIEAVTINGNAQNFSRDLGNEPPNVINPLTLSAFAIKIAEENGLICTVIDDATLTNMGANAIVAVGKGSNAPSRLIILEHPGEDPDAPPVAVLGKAITFDTGGYSLKTVQGIVGMKYDKCGGMAVMGVMQAVAQLNLKQRVVGVIAAAENMISGDAYRPNDIIHTLSGKTVEVISTDAEGRMVLADALTYTEQTYQPKAIIDFATLTGGVMVALGKLRAGLMTNNDELAQALYAAGESSGEQLWRLPLDEEYLEQIKGHDSDLKNSGGRFASAIIGGKFLQQFTSGKTPWAHIDIAGVAWHDTPKGHWIKGATGFGVRLTLDYLRSLS